MKKSLSDSYANVGQGIILLFFTPFNILIWRIVFWSSFTSSVLFVAVFITALSTFITSLAFKTADVFIQNGIFIVKRLFVTTKISSKQYKQIGSLLPFGYYLEFEDRKRVYVLFGPNEIVKQFTSSKSNEILKKVESLIHQELHG